MADRGHRIFLSYARDEAPFVRAVADALKEHGVDPGLDREFLEAGGTWREELSGALADSGMVVVFIGKAVDSPWLNFEIGAAVGQAKPVVPVYLSESGARDAPSLVSDLQGIDASDLKPDEVAREIASAIKMP